MPEGSFLGKFFKSPGIVADISILPVTSGAPPLINDHVTDSIRVNLSMILTIIFELISKG